MKKDKKKNAVPTSSKPEQPATQPSADVRFHLRAGWWSLLVFLSLGILLETMHGFKVQWYVGEQNATRRLMWTLAHAHGTLMALVNIAYAFTIYACGDTFRSSKATSRCIALATLLVPLGFFLGGLKFYDGDPGPGILVVPIGAVLLLLCVLQTARSL